MPTLTHLYTRYLANLSDGDLDAAFDTFTPHATVRVNAVPPVDPGTFLLTASHVLRAFADSRYELVESVEERDRLAAVYRFSGRIVTTGPHHLPPGALVSWEGTSITHWHDDRIDQLRLYQDHTELNTALGIASRHASSPTPIHPIDIVTVSSEQRH